MWGIPFLLRKKKPQPEIAFAPLDDLGRMVQEAIDDLAAAPDGIEREGADPPPRYNGYCARACQAYIYLARDSRTRRFASDPDATPMFHKEEGAEYGDSHYWLETRAGVMDLIFAPDDEPDPGFPYWDRRRASSQGFHPAKSDPRYPNRLDARKIVDAVWDRVAGGSELGDPRDS